MTMHLGDGWGLDKILDELSQKPVEGFTRVYNRYTRSVEEVKLTLLNKISIALSDEAKVKDRTYPGWSGYLPFFVYTTATGGNKVMLLDYRHGYRKRLDRHTVLE